MTDFNDYDDTPTEADLDACYGSKYLSATEVGNRKVKTKIERIRKENLKQQNGGTRTKFVISFATDVKDLVLNATNKNTLVDALGKKPADWIGADIGLFTEPTVMAGKPSRGVRLRVLNKPISAAPKPVVQADPPWPVEADDPGFNDSPNLD